MVQRKVCEQDIVVTGVSGRYPQSENVEELWENLMNSKVLYRKDEFPYPKIFSRIPVVRGALKDASKFDHEFFGFNEIEAHSLDPQIRILLEVVYESMWDAGIAPVEWRGTRTGFFLGSSFDDTGLSVRWDHKIDFPQYFSQRISHFFDFRGPTMIVDTACASSLNALHQAYWSMKQGECDQAIVAGISIHLKPLISIGFSQLEMLSKSGGSYGLDSGADGYVRSEAIVAVVLQKQSQAKRICAKIISSVTSSDGYTKEGITFPSEQVQIETMKEAIRSAGLTGLEVNYVEAHITGTPAGDPIESSSILNSYRGDNPKPIMIGCLKSNIGHSEASAGLCALSKVIKILETGLIPPIVNLKNPNPRVIGLMTRILPVEKVTPFSDQYIGIDAFGFGGANTHCIVQSPTSLIDNHNSKKNSNKRLDDFPHLICLCNRTRTGIEEMFRFFNRNHHKLTTDYAIMLNGLSNQSDIGMKWKGFAILDGCVDYDGGGRGNQNGSFSWINGSIDHADGRKHSLGLIIGPNIDVILEELLENQIFQQLVENISSFLGKNGIRVGSNRKKSAKNFSDSYNKLILQIAFIDLLQKMKISPDWIACQSSDKIVAQYAFNMANREDIKQHLISKPQSDLINGNSSSDKHHQSIVHSSESKQRNSLSKNYRFMEAVIEKMKDFDLLNTNNQSNEKNSEIHLIGRKASTFESKNLSTMNIMYLDSEARFIKASSSIDSTLINKTISNSKNSSNSIRSFLNCLGQLFISGYPLDINQLYPKPKYPIAHDSPRIGHLLKWNHERSFDNMIYPEFFRPSFHTVHRFDLLDANFADLAGYTINGKDLLPAAGYLWIIWDHLVKMRCVDQKLRNHSFEIWSTTIHHQTSIAEPIEFRMVSNPVTHEFSIKLGTQIFVTGFARIVDEEPYDYSQHLVPKKDSEHSHDPLKLESDHFYHEMMIRGFQISDSYRVLNNAVADGSRGEIKFNGNWIIFTQACLQMCLLQDQDRCLSLPTHFEWFRSDPSLLYKSVKLKRKAKDESGLTVSMCKSTNIVATNGLVFKIPDHQIIERELVPKNLHYKTQIFLPLESKIPLDRKLALQKAEYSEKCDQLLRLLNQMTRNEIKNLQSTTFYGEYRPQQPGDVLEILSQSRREKDWKKFLTNELIVKKCSPKLMIVDVVMDIAGQLIDLFEENAPNDSTISIKQVGCNSFDFREELDFHFRRIRNRYEFEIEDPTNSEDLVLSTEDLLIVNHFSLLILPSKNPSYYSDKWKDAVQSMKPSSFVLINTRDSLVQLEKTLAQVLISDVNELESSESLEAHMLSNGFVLISKLTSEDSDIKSMLFRKKPKIDLSRPPLIIPIDSSDGYQWVENIKNSVKNDENERIWLITSDSYENGITGLGCSLREEKFGSKIRIIFAPNWDIKKNEGVFQLMQIKDLVINMRKNDQWGTLRHIEMDPNDEVQVIDRKNILKWSFEPRSDDSNDFNPIPVWFRSPKIDLNDDTHGLNFYSPINFSNYLYAKSTNLVGKPKLSNPWESLIGHEFAGINRNGQKIAGLCVSNGISNTIDESKVLFEFETPENWTLKDAATVPLAYFMAYYALKEIAHLQPGSSLLINGMKDGIGEAILSIGSEMNYNMIVIVQTEATRKHLSNIFPKLNDDQVIIKPSQITVDEVILRATNGYGLEAIINLDSNTDINALADCSTLDGLIINFTQNKSIHSNKLDGTRLPNNATLINICVSSFISSMSSEPNNYQRMKSRITDHIRIGLKNGQIRPITSIIYEKDQIDDAFDQLINNPDYSGKIIIKIRDENSSQIISSNQTVSPSVLSKLESATIPVKCVARTCFYPHKWYIILGGLGGVGLQLAQFMASRGARKIVLSSRSGIKDQFQKYVIQRIENKYPDINIMVHQEASPTRDSCLNLTLKLKRSGPIGGIFNLAAVLSSGIFENQTPESFRAACAPKVQLTKYWDSITRQECPELDYFLIFSSVSSHGLLGEANYSYANSCVERLIEERRQIGLPGLAIQYGKIGDVGMATEYRSDIAGSAAQNIWSVIEALDKFLQLPYSVCYSVVHAAKQEDSDDSKAGLLQRIGHILGLKNLEALDSTVTLGDLGLDSLQAIEVQNLIESTCMVSIPNIGIMKLTIADLIELRDQAAESSVPDGTTDQQGKPTDFARVKSYHEEILITLYDNSGPPIFFFPPALFDFLSMLPLAQAMSRKVIGLDLNDQVRDLGTMDNIAEFYCDKILETYPNEAKYDFVGYSYGCLLGFEVAKVMQERLGPDRCNRIVFIDASPYGLKKLGQFTLNSVLEGRSVGDIFCETMGHMGVKVSDSMRQNLLDAEDDDDRYSELVSEVMAGAGMNGPTDAFTKNATNMVDRGYYMSEMDGMGIFHGDALFIQVVNKAHHGKQSLVNAGLSEIIDGNIETVTYDASHFAILQTYGKDIARDIEKMMPL